MPLLAPLIEALGKDATLTGRIPLWNQMINVMSQHRTFTGYGYGSFWKDSEATGLMHQAFSGNSFMGNMTSGAHNNLLELWGNAGLIGVAALLAMVLICTRRRQEIAAGARHYVTMFMLYYMATGWTERHWGNYEYPLLFLFFSMALACRERETVQPARHTGARAAACRGRRTILGKGTL